MVKSGQFHQGVKSGVWIEKFVSGESAYIPYVNGQPDGVSVAFYADGALWAIGRYDSGQQTGVWKRWDKQGELISEEHWQDGKRVR